MKVDVISASAGTGKTHTLTEELTGALLDESIRPEGVVAITYTVKGANELESRIRTSLLEKGKTDLAARVRDGYMGTIHSVCQRLLREFALEAGLSPWLQPIPELERRSIFSVSVGDAAQGEEAKLNELALRLSMEDWKVYLLRIVEAAQNNGMNAAALARSAAASRKRLTELLGVPTMNGSNYLKALTAAHARLQPVLESAAGESKAAGDRAEDGRSLGADLARGQMPPWKDQVQFAQAVSGKKLASHAGDLITLVNGHLGCETFQSDLMAVQDGLFALAAKVLQGFVNEKASARAVDFGDMLDRAYALLGLPVVQDALRARLDLILVDEFQDTSPLQLAVVSRLGQLAKRSIWVGDRKQAIFSFQGSDPELMASATDAALGGKSPRILGESWRSRTELVNLVSELFTAALAPHGFPKEQVALVPALLDPPAMKDQPCFATWEWMSTKAVKATEEDAIAEGIVALMAKPPLVRVRTLSKAKPPDTRTARLGDIAVLAWTNAHGLKIAQALRARGIPAKVSLAGLTGTPEGVFARAALGLLADTADGVAAFEVSWLGGHGIGDPDGWLSTRLAEMAQWRKQADECAARGEPTPAVPRAFLADPIVAALHAAGAEAVRLSPAEALDLAIRVARIPERLRSWPEPAQRLANLEALRAEARAYEDRCLAQRNAGTILGLVEHLSTIGGEKEENRQATTSSVDAVTVSTWHKAKGLEWPVVILAQLDSTMRDPSPFDVGVESAPAFDLARPLDGRVVRWIPWPYGKMSANLALLDKATATDWARKEQEAAEREQLRLLYVGFTRPRDMLVLCGKVTEKSGLAIPRLDPLVTSAGSVRLGLPFGSAPGLHQVSVGVHKWPCQVFKLPGLPPVRSAITRDPVPWYAPAAVTPRPREKVNPSSEPLPGTARIRGAQSIGSRKAISVSTELYGSLGDAVHAFLAADMYGDRDQRTKIATRLLRAYGVEGAVSSDSLLSASDDLHAWVKESYSNVKWHREWPVRARVAGPPSRLVVGEVDLYLELPDGFILVDHKSFSGTVAERDRRAVEEYAPQLRWYALVLASALKKPLKASFIHLPLRGEIVELELGVEA